MQRFDVATPEGACPTFLHTPSNGAGPWPAALLYMDGPGMRPAMHEIAARLAGAGYAVFLPDLFYRSGPYDPVDPKLVFTNPDLRQAHREKYMSHVTAKAAMSDTQALLSFIATRAEAKAGPIGVVGYCMGGRLALVAAGTFGDRIGAAASYHGASLATDASDSPHLLAPKMSAKVYVAGAIEDANFDDAQKARLEAALAGAGVDHQVETYPAKHGWVPRDMHVHDPAEAEHHWRTLIPLFDNALNR